MKKRISLLVCFVLLFAGMPLGVHASDISKQESVSDYGTTIEQLYSLEGKEIYISDNERAVMNRVVVEPVTNIKSEGGIITPMWTYTMEYTMYQVFNSLDAPVPSSKWVSVPIGLNDPSGNPYYANGYVYHVGTAYNFPSQGMKEAVYEGTLSCWIN